MKNLKALIGTVAVALSLTSIAAWAARDKSVEKKGNGVKDTISIEKSSEGRSSPECDRDGSK